MKKLQSTDEDVLVGQVVGGMVAPCRYVDSAPAAMRVPCGHKNCGAPSTEGEAFRLKTAPGSRYKTKLTWFWRCEQHEHSHWRQIGFGRTR